MSLEQKRRIGEDLRRWRLERDLSLEKLSKLAGVSYQTAYRMESMRKRPNFNFKFGTLTALARALGRKVKIEIL